MKNLQYIDLRGNFGIELLSFDDDIDSEMLKRHYNVGLEALELQKKLNNLKKIDLPLYQWEDGYKINDILRKKRIQARHKLITFCNKDKRTPGYDDKSLVSFTEPTDNTNSITLDNIRQKYRLGTVRSIRKSITKTIYPTQRPTLSEDDLNLKLKSRSGEAIIFSDEYRKLKSKYISQTKAKANTKIGHIITSYL